MRFEGGPKPRIAENGDLVFESGSGELRQKAPVVWQETRGQRRAIACKYVLSGVGEVQIQLSEYDRAQELVIDPIISYSTYLNGPDGAATSAIAVDSSGFAYVTGYADVGFPDTAGIFKDGFGFFITKLNAGGTGLIYSTFIGGSGSGEAHAIAIDSGGNAYVTGATQAADFPFTVGQFTGIFDGFAAKVDPIGQLVYATALSGESFTDGGLGIAVDTAGAAYVVGRTTGENFHATSGALKTGVNFVNNAFVAKLTATGQISYATYLGGSQEDWGTAIAIDSSGNAYIGGTTSSPDFPVTPNAFSTSYHGNYDSFIAKLNPTGSALIYATFLGGSSSENSRGLTVDAAGNCYVTGTTGSSDFPTTPGAFLTTASTGSSYATKLNATGTALIYSTFLGPQFGAEAIAIDASGAAYIGGRASGSLLTTPGALRITPSPYGADIFVLKLSSDGATVPYATLLGSADTYYTSLRGLALDGNGGVYVTGNTNSKAYPTTAGAFQVSSSTTQGSVLSFVTKIDFNSPTLCDPSVSPTSQTLPGRGGSIAFNLTLAAGCPWEAIPSTGITLNAPTHGVVTTSPIALSGTVGQNNNTSAGLTQTVTLGAATFTVNQDPGSCQDPVISTGAIAYDSTGGSQSLNLVLPSGCAWTAEASTAWLTVTGNASGTGPATITIASGQNSGALRTAMLTIAGKSISVTQSAAACMATISGSPQSFSGLGSTGLVSVTMNSSTCNWSAYSTASWIQVVPQTSSGQGSGMAPFLVSPNPGSVARTGYIVAAEQTLTITQSAGPAGSLTNYTMSTYAGGGSSSVANLGDGGPATSAYLNDPLGLAFDRSTGNLYIVDAGSSRIRVVTPDGKINTFAGGGSSSGENVPALSAQLVSTTSIAVDNASAIYFDDSANRVRKINNGTVVTFAGSTTAGFSGDHGAATSALMSTVRGIAADSLGNVYIADEGNSRVREVSGGNIATVAGGGSAGLNDGGLATSATMDPWGVAVDGAQNLYIADYLPNGYVRKVSQGIINSLPTNRHPTDVAVDPLGSVFFLGPGTFAVVEVSAGGTITDISLSPTFLPGGITTDASGNVYFSDTYTNLVQELSPVPNFCAYSVTSPSGVIAGAGATVMISVTAAAACNWTASSGSAGASISSGSSGSGSGSVAVTIAANTTGSTQSLTLAIAGQVINLTQLANPPALGFVSLTPCRVADTRTFGGQSGAFGPPALPAQTSRDFPIPTSSCGAPSTASAYSLNFTVAPPGPVNYLTTWPAGQSQPLVSTLNDLSGGLVANAAIVPAGTNGAISVFAWDATDLIMDINGYFAPPSAPNAMAFYPVTPCRVADTRNASGTFGGPQMSAQQTRSFPVPSSSCGIPASAAAYSLNMTVVPPGPLAYLTTWPAGESQPLVSTLNDLTGDIVANAAIVPAGTAGAVDVFVYNDANVIIDINGYFAPPNTGGLYFHSLPPCRVADTRSAPAGTFAGPSLAGGETRSFPIPSSSCGVPVAAQAYSLNMTVVPSGPLAYLSAWPTGQTQPLVSTLNDESGGIVANAAIVPAGTNGAISVFAWDPTNLIIDINGYFAP